ncbi:hypothetical protein RJZ56_004996 [Blastomyces dermatitidis]|uniref:RNA binding protein Rnp24 n=1 Tax=Ajellomyces dermatitidis (strain ATCC 18188 / CBS 674.68) TaxID=653446 RepID=F2TSJ3_AJEDA|nr:RNA binding protein Rnp24 [Blastomyces dermatitidis ATCC 18188]
MPGIKEASPSGSPPASRKRKLDEGPALEIDLSAPEPPSKKALRKAKKKGAAAQTTEQSTTPPATKPKSPEPAEKPSKRSSYGVWIGNLPFNAKKDDVRVFFTSSGSLKNEEITRIHLPEGIKQNGKPQNKGFAYVDFTTQKAMEAAIAMSEQLISGRRALVKNANNFVGRPDKPKDEAAGNKTSNSTVHAPSKRVFVGNLGFDVTKEILEEHFKPCGVIESIQVATFQDTGKCKGYAWVEFESIDAAEAAMRGFVHVPEEEEDDDDHDDDDDEKNTDSLNEVGGSRGEESQSKAKAKNKKPTTKRVWVNRIMGRPLRMEFAEDKATRYKKRFGKDGTSKDKFATESGGEEQVRHNGIEPPAIEEVSEKNTKSFQKSRAGKGQGNFKKGGPARGGRYTQDVVQRLSGAIVESQGKKTTFD